MSKLLACISVLRPFFEGFRLAAADVMCNSKLKTLKRCNTAAFQTHVILHLRLTDPSKSCPDFLG